MGQLAILKEFKKPITLIVFIFVLLIVIGIIRYMRKDKRLAKQQVKAMEAELIFQAEKDKGIYEKAGETFGVDATVARICDQVAKGVAGAFGSGAFGNDNEESIILQLNRLGGAKSIACADFFFKKYSKKTNPNIAFDSISTLSLMEWKRIKETLRDPLLAHAKLKGSPSRDYYF
jgi:hypothetical protein